MDQQLRELERRWNESGSIEDEAAYLLERVRADDLASERLHVAAFLGHAAAAQAAAHFPLSKPLKQVAQVFRDKPGALEPWFTQFGCPREKRGKGYRYDLGAIVRWKTSLAYDEGPNAARYVATDDYRRDFLNGRFVRDGIEARVRASCLLGVEVASRAVIASRRCSDLACPPASSQSPSTLYLPLSEVLDLFEEVVVLGDEQACAKLKGAGAHRPRTVAGGLSSALSAKREATRTQRLMELVTYGVSWQEADGTVREVEPPRFLEAIAQELVPWALGHSDPVRERIEARSS